MKGVINERQFNIEELLKDVWNDKKGKKNGRGYFILDIWIVCFNCYYCLGRNIGKYGGNGNYYEYY